MVIRGLFILQNELDSMCNAHLFLAFCTFAFFHILKMWTKSFGNKHLISWPPDAAFHLSQVISQSLVKNYLTKDIPSIMHKVKDITVSWQGRPGNRWRHVRLLSSTDWQTVMTPGSVLTLNIILLVTWSTQHWHTAHTPRDVQHSGQ